MEKYNITDKEKEAIIKLIDYADWDSDDWERLYEDDTVTINEGRNGKSYAWFQTESQNLIIDIETLEIFTDEEIIEDLLC